MRSQRAETKEVAKCEKKRQQMAEVVYSQVQAEIQKEHTNQRRSSVKFSLKQLSTLTTGEELAEILENTSDPLTVQVIIITSTLRLKGLFFAITIMATH